MSKPTLILMVGICASGKSTVAQKLAETYDGIVISSDILREELWGDRHDRKHNQQTFTELRSRMQQYLKSGKNVVVDATNLTIKSRKSFLEVAKNINCIKYAVIVNKPYEKCLKDNEIRDYSVPQEVITNMRNRFQIPFYEEGFDYITFLYDTSNGKLPLEHYLESMEGFEQDTPHHLYDLGEHCQRLFRELMDKYFLPNIVNNAIYAAAELHDVGKLYTQTYDKNGVAHYYSHANVGAYKLASELAYIDHDFFLDMLFFINYHMLPFDWNTEKSKTKWKNIFGEEKFKLLECFNEADKTASGTYTE